METISGIVTRKDIQRSYRNKERYERSQFCPLSFALARITGEAWSVKSDTFEDASFYGGFRSRVVCTNLDTNRQYFPDDHAACIVYDYDHYEEEGSDVYDLIMRLAGREFTLTPIAA